MLRGIGPARKRRAGLQAKSSGSKPAKKRDEIKMKGSKNLRYRLLCATLASKPIVISDIRSLSDSPGLTDYEASFLRLLDKVSSGSSISINETGTKLRYKPGSVIGGYDLTHECPTTRGIGYLLEPLLILCLFAKKPTEITFTGVTDANTDLSIDVIRSVTVNLLRHFGVEQKVEVKSQRRGTQPNGGGQVSVAIPVVKTLKPIDLLDPGKVKRVRGVSYVCRCSPQFANRMVSAARGVFNKFIPDVYIYTDQCKGKMGGLSSGFGCSLTAESTNGTLLCSQVVPKGAALPEDVGKKAAKMLCEEIKQGGCVDSFHQPFMVVLMVLSPEDVGRLRIGKLSKTTIEVLRLCKEFFGVTFMIKPDPETKTVILSCFGAGYQNFTRKHC